MDNWVTYADVVVRGYGCDNLWKDGSLLLIVRPLENPPKGLPASFKTPAPAHRRRPFPTGRIPIVLDILVEPLSVDSCRFAYSIALPLAPSVPSWAVNMLLGQGMAEIFASMQRVARRMAAGDETSPHVQHARKPAGSATVAWIAARVDPFIATMTTAMSQQTNGNGASGARASKRTCLPPH